MKRKGNLVIPAEGEGGEKRERNGVDGGKMHTYCGGVLLATMMIPLGYHPPSHPLSTRDFTFYDHMKMLIIPLFFLLLHIPWVAG